MRATRLRVAAIVLAILAIELNESFLYASAFQKPNAFVSKRHQGARHVDYMGPLSLLQSTSNSRVETEVVNEDDDLLQTVTREQLEDLCLSLQLSPRGTKQDMLLRLRELAKRNAESEHQRILGRKQRVEEGSEDSKERYEIINNNSPVDDEDDDEPVFYYPMPVSNQDETAQSNIQPKTKPAVMVTSDQVTAPPIPLSEPNEQGERSVTIYSTADQNDMTGVAAAQPGASAQAMDSLMSAVGSSGGTDQPWDAAEQSASRGKATQEEEVRAHGRVVELVDTLMAMSGLAAYAEQLDENDDEDDEEESDRSSRLSSAIRGPVGFQPAKVSTQMLAATSQALRMNRGEVLQEVMKQFEIQAIGLDGMAGDDLESGGGHYKEVSKVRAFLEGYRRAEVRRIARETTTLLLDKLVSEGVEGLDLCLSGMTRSSDDTSDVAGELNDSLLEYLNDAIRQQEKRVDQIVSDRVDASEAAIDESVESDSVNNLWEITEEEGDRIESLDPNDPHVKKVLQDEYVKSKSTLQAETPLPESAPEKLLLLLTLLRDRIKAEGAFGRDEKGRNLRLLAYCLKVPADERQNLIIKDIGGSLDRLDSFVELVLSSIEYGESTSHQLQPSKKRSLDVNQLKSIVKMTQDVREKQAFKAGAGGLDV